MLCPGCGRNIDDYRDQCPSCGASVASSWPTQPIPVISEEQAERAAFEAAPSGEAAALSPMEAARMRAEGVVQQPAPPRFGVVALAVAIAFLLMGAILFAVTVGDRRAEERSGARRSLGGARPARQAIPSTASPSSEASDPGQAYGTGDGSFGSPEAEDGEEGEPAEGSAGGEASGAKAGEEQAAAVLGEFLYALQEGRADDAQKLTTDKFRDANAGFFENTSGRFADFEFLKSARNGAVWEIEVRELWDSGPRVSKYGIAQTTGGPKVDSLTR